MVVYYAPQAGRLRPRWSKTVFPRVLKTPDLWLCITAHGALVALVRLGYLDVHEDHQIVPFEVVGPLVLLTVLGLLKLVGDCWRRHEDMVRACAKVGEETLTFVQDLQATFGRVDEALFLRFVAAKYALASVYVFFFAITNGAVPGRCWAELRAKGLLDDREVQFLEGHYKGDRMALVHVWAMWAVNEAAALPSARAQLGSEALAGGISRLHSGLQGVSVSAREVAARVAVPVPYHYFQLNDLLVLVTMLLMAAVAAPLAPTTFYAATVAYIFLLVAVLAIREIATSLSDPLRKGSTHGFPVAAAVNATADAVAQLLIGCSPSVFNPCHAWWDAGRALFSQGQIERRTPLNVFPSAGANAYCWKDVKSPTQGEQAPPPLIDVGCCHLDAEALPPRKDEARRAGHAYQIERRPHQEGVGVLLARLQAELDMRGKQPNHLSCVVGSPPESSTMNPSESSWEANSWKRDQASPTLGEDDDWDAIAERISTLPREHSLASTPVISASRARVNGLEAAAHAQQLANVAPICGVEPKEDFVVAGKWANPADQLRCRGCASSVSPEGLILYTTSTAGLQEPHRKLFGPDGMPLKAVSPGMASAIAALAAAQAAGSSNFGAAAQATSGSNFPTIAGVGAALGVGVRRDVASGNAAGAAEASLAPEVPLPCQA